MRKRSGLLLVLALVGVVSAQPIQDPASGQWYELIMSMTGKVFQGRPSFGSWISYGLGTLNQNLPAYVVLRDPKGYNTSGTLTWNSGFLPSLYGGTEFSSEGAPVLNLNPARKQHPGVQA